MAHDFTRPDGVPDPSPSSTVVKATTTLMVFGSAAVTADLLSCDDGEFHTVAMASPDGVASVVLAGSVHDLTSVFQAALAVLPHESGADF
jgi:hypothetical protein